MSILQEAFVFFILLPFLVRIIYGISCIDNSNCLGTQYNFYLQYQESNYDCGNLPMFNLSCNSQGNTILSLPHTGDFYVHFISEDITCFNCTSMIGEPVSFSIVVSRLGELATTAVVVSTDPGFDDYKLVLENMGCNINGVVQDHVSTKLFGDILITLSWNSPKCSMSELGKSPSQTDDSKMNKIRRFMGYFCLVAFVIIPSFVIALIASYMYFMHRRSHRYDMNAYLVAINATAAATSGARPPPSAVITEGLDESTIELHTEKLVVGESEKLQGKDNMDMTCSICLGDYCPEEILRCILECQHYFHVACVDQWLRTKGICPVCRHPIVSSDTKA